MKPIVFDESNTIFGVDQDEYNPLPARAANNEEHTCVFCWKLSLSERLRVLLTGVVWHEVMTFGRPLQPQKLSIEKPVM